MALFFPKVGDSKKVSRVRALDFKITVAELKTSEGLQLWELTVILNDGRIIVLDARATLSWALIDLQNNVIGPVFATLQSEQWLEKHVQRAHAVNPNPSTKSEESANI
jgi:hypothetical protein